MNGFVGHVGVLLGLLGALSGMGYIGVGLRRDDASLVRRGITASFLLLGGAIVATIAMEHALITHDFSLAFVAENNARETPLFFRPSMKREYESPSRRAAALMRLIHSARKSRLRTRRSRYAYASECRSASFATR